MIDTKLLRQKILDLAIRGKLVPQNPADEPASELLKKIKAEKEALVKAGKIKKDKHESFIFRGDDKRYYEQIDGKTNDISDEIPFDLPEGWGIARIGQCIKLLNGRAYKQNELLQQGRYKVLRVGNFFTNSSWYYSDLELEPEKYCYPGDLLYAWSASFGPQIWTGPKTIFHYHIWNVKFSGKLFDKSFLYHFFMYDKDKLQGATTGSTMIHVSMEHMNPRFIPIPPRAEQQRIVAQIESLLKCVDEIDRESETLEKSITLAKQKILDLAIRGKLVPQDPKDEPASELLKKVKAEKEALIKAGKLKRDKHESFIFRGDDNCYHENIDGKSSDITGEIPFELPQSWIWCRIGNIGTINPRNHVADDSTMVSFMPMTQLEGGYGSNYTLSERTWQDVKTGFTHIQENDVVFAKITPCFQNRKSAIMRGLKNGYGAGTTELHVIRCFFPVFPEYILWFLKNQTFISDAVSTIQGVVGQQRIDANFIRNYLLPLPPLSEQKRIVAQVEKLLSVLETMRG